MLPRSLSKLSAIQLMSRSYSTGTGSETGPLVELDYKDARPFNDIPGPSTFGLLRGFLPGGAYFKKSATSFINILRQQYGDIIKMPGTFGKDPVVFAFDPEMYRNVFRNEGTWPLRKNFDTVDYHRKVHRKDFFDGVEGLLMSSGEPWSRFRTAVNPILLQPKNARLYLKKLLEVNNEFLLRVREIRDPITQEVPDTFEDEINRLAFESVSVIALDKQLGLIRRDRDQPEAQKLFKSVREFFDLAYELDVLPSPWKIIKTPKFRKMMKTADYILDTLTKYIDEGMVEIDKKSHLVRDDDERSVAEKLLLVDRRIAILTAMDLLMAGVDTTSSTIAGLLLAISANPQKQEKLRQEIRQILPQKDSLLTLQNMNNLPYLRACIKEGIRLYPVSPGTMRTLPTDLVLGGYQVPRNIGVAVVSNMLQRDEKYYPKPNEFIPERWLRIPGAEDEQLIPEASHPFVYIPFGFGVRSCAGRRIVEMELEITIARLVRNFHIGFNYSTENPFKAKFINVPAIPLKFSFTDVEN